MARVDRRTMLAAIALGVVASVFRVPMAAAVRLPAAQARVPAPVGVLTRLPGDGNQLALTVDDGVSSPVVAAFAQFCRDTGTRLTFFVNGVNPSWSDNAPALRSLVDSGQVQIANHTWSHPYLNRISLSAVHDQIKRNADFLLNTYGRDGAPYFRPPYGVHNADIDRVAPDLGYTPSRCGAGRSAIRSLKPRPTSSRARCAHSRRNRSCWPTPTCQPSRTATTN